MVMEAPPSPQSVGREFVRQYYTLLNKAPTHLHRFYNHQSSFVHGGLDPPNRETAPVIGQKQIHQKIQQLNFRDCHAKITQVDSQSTLGNGVVVQVTGELSNAGQPMRRFTQTFVLASQSPKKYYVHNDIFRYQDEIISDEECDPDSRSEPEDEPLQTQAPVSERPPLEIQQQPLGQPAPGLNPYYGAAAPTAAPPVLPQAQLPPQHQPVSAAPVPHHQAPPHVLAQQQPLQAPPALNGHPEDLNVLQGQPLPNHLPSVPQHNLGTPMAMPPQEYQAAVPLNQQSPLEEVSHQQDVEENTFEERVDGGYGDVAEVEQEQDMPSEPASNEPKTYANLFKSGASMTSQPPQNTYQAPSQHQGFGSQSPPDMGGTGPRGVPQTNGTSKPSGPRVGQQQSRSSYAGGARGGGRNSVYEEDDRSRRQGSIGGSDANQLFLGNLPHVATEEELREIFSEYGRVLDLRVHSFSKPGGGNIKPGAGGRAPPNYGFITYESQQSLQICLQAKPIYYPKDDPSGTLLNVEEKKNNRDRDRPSYGGGKPSGDNNRSAGGRGDSMGGPRRDRPMGDRGERGPGGMNRSSGGPGGPQTGRTDQRSQGGYGNRSGGGPNRTGGPPNSYGRR